MISTLFALLAAFLTAVISFVKLVNDKEGKISEFREQWTTSARQALAELISKLLAIAQVLEERAYRADNCNRTIDHIQNSTTDLEKELLTGMHEYERTMLEKTNELRRELMRDIHHANQLARLHFKLNDPDTAGLECKIDAALDLVATIETVGISSDEEKVKELTARIRMLSAEISMLCRVVIKGEWEKVKRGEPTYVKTKRAAKWAVLVFFMVFVGTIGIHAYISKPMGTASDTANSTVTADRSASPVLEKPAVSERP